MRLEHPQVLWLAAVVIPALIGFLFWSWRVKQKLILQFVHARLAASLTRGASPAREKARLALLVAAVAGVLCALARPQWGFAWEEAHQRGLDIMVAVDTSRSMLATDVLPNRLEKTKLAVIDLMRQAKSDRLGLVVFAGAAFLQAPLTLDESAFQQAVDAVSVGIVPVGGTSLSSAIRTSLAAFEKGNDNHKVLVLFTDGEDHDVDTDTMAAVKEAAEAGMRIFTIGVGTPAGELLQVTDDQGNTSFVKDDNGDAVKSRLNQTLLQKIATEANGFYLPLQGADPMEMLYARGLAPLPKSEEATRLTRVYKERYHWFLGFAVICLIIETLLPDSSRPRSRGARSAAAVQSVAAALALMLVTVSAAASPSSAFRDYQSGDFKGAFDEYNRLARQKTNDYRLHYDAGTAAYKAKELETARTQLNAALNTPDIIADPQDQQRAYYNLGNTLYRMGEPLPEPDKKKELWQQAIENYVRAVRLNTNDIDARNNLAFVKRQLEELKRQQQQQKQQQDKDQKDQKDQQQQDQKQQQNKDQKDQKQQQQQQQQSQKSDQQKKAEEKARQEQAKKDQEKKEQQAQANQGEQKDKKDENGEPAAAAQLRMSPEEARKLLEAMKDDAKVLLFSPTNQPVNTQHGPFKDW